MLEAEKSSLFYYGPCSWSDLQVKLKGAMCKNLSPVKFTLPTDRVSISPEKLLIVFRYITWL